MLTKVVQTGLLALLLLIGTMPALKAQSITKEYDHDYDRARIDRYLDVEVWTDHSDGEYYAGDNVVIYFRANRDAFVSIYSIDTRGRVNLLFPTDPTDDNFILGGVTYSLPGADDDYDLAVTGPEGFENIQIIASRERFPVPNWYHNSGLVDDWEDRDEYMDYLNTAHFVRYGGQRFAYDRAAIYVNEWEEYYFRPIYYPYYPSWTLYGNAYIDYPWGASIYINGIYWGCAPLYIPRIAIGWHTITIYDHYHHCWESDFHVSRYNTVVFNNTIVKPTPTIRSKYKEVRVVGYRDPVKNGYPGFKTRKMLGTPTIAKKTGQSTKATRSGTTTITGLSSDQPPAKKYLRGSAKLVKTDRGYETDAATAIMSAKKRASGGSRSRQVDATGKSSKTGSGDRLTGKRSTSSASGRKTGSSRKVGKSTGQKSQSGSSGYYQKKSGSSGKRKSSATVRSGAKASKSTKSVQSKSGSKSKGSKPSSSSVKQKPSSKKSAESSKTVKSKSNKKSSGSSRKPDSKSGGGKGKKKR